MDQMIGYDVADGVATVTLNRPDRLNSFTEAMHHALAAALDQAQADPSVRALLLTGTGRAFCAGQDLADRGVAPGDAPVDLGRSVEQFYNPLVRRIAGIDKPVIAAVNGVAAGAGANIALGCDIVVAARSARFILSFAAIGLIPDTGGTWVLPRAIGLPRALGMALTGDPVDAETAERWGLIWKCVDDVLLVQEAGALARRLATGAALGLAETKRALRASFEQGFDEALDIERELMRRLGATDDYREGVAAFAARRKPVFTGR